MKKLSKKMKKAGVVCLAGALVVTSAVTISSLHATSVYAVDATEETATQTAVESNFQDLLKQTDYANTVAKDETVYVATDAEGNVVSTKVSEWLRNGTGADSITDYSNLKNIENTSGDETYKEGDSENSIVWDAQGNDITYTGDPTEDLPVEVKVSYYLDGEKMSAKEIAGKSGTVTIRFDYKVNRMDTVTVDGTSYTLTHPYTMASGLMLDSDHFRNVTVSNGRAVSDGDYTVVLGVAFPGLAEDLDLSSFDIDVPESVTITAVTDNFTLDGTYTVALSEAIGTADFSTDDIDAQIKSLKDGMNSLSDASDQLVEGANQLAAGSSQLREGSSELLSGIQALASGLGELSSNGSTLVSATNQLKSSIFAMATETLQQSLVESGYTEEQAAAFVLSPDSSSPNYYKTVLNNIGQSAITTAESTLRSALSAQGITDTSSQNIILARAYNLLTSAGNTNPTTEDITAAITQAGTEAGTAQTISGVTSNETYQVAAVKLLSEYAASQESTFDPTTTEAQQQIAVLTVEMYLAKAAGYTDTPEYLDMATLSNFQSKAQELLTTAQTFAAYQSAETNPAADVTALAVLSVASNQAAQESLAALESSEAQLDQVIAYTEGVKAYVAGVNSAYAGSQKLVSGMGTMNDGIASLDDGVKELQSGIAKFDEEGIDSLVDSMSTEEVENLLARFKALQKASQKQIFIGGIDSNMTQGESKMIIKTASAK